jgi:hypothetical protein
MDKPIEQMSLEDIAAEREQIAAERADLERQRNERASRRLEAVIDGKDVEDVTKPEPTNLAEFARAQAEANADDGAVRELYEAIAEEQEAKAAPEGEAPQPEPWPHEHLVHMGMELDVRIPNQSALVAVSMLQQLDGLGELQMEIFNSFLGNHLSPQSLGKVIMELMRPDTEMSIQSLVQALVNMRVAQIEAS